MKKCLKLLSVLLVLVMMTGCVKYNVDMKITDDKKMELSAIIATQSGVEDETRKKFENAGFKVEDYKDDQYTGIKISKSYSNIDKVSSKDEVTVDLNKFLAGEEPKNFFKKDGNKYSAKFKFNISSVSSDPLPEPETETETDGVTTTGPETTTDTDDTEIVDTTDDNDGWTVTTDDDDDEEDDDTDYSNSEPEIILTVEVPKLVSSNADKKDGNKLTWNLYTHTGDVTFEFEAGTKSNLMLYACIAAGVVAVLVVVVLLTKKGKKAPAAPVAAPTPVEPTPVAEEVPAEEPKTE